VLKHHTMKAHVRQHRYTSRQLHEFSTSALGWRLMVSFTFRPPYPQGYNLHCPLTRMLGEPQSWFGRFGDETCIEHRLLGRPIRPGSPLLLISCYVTILYRLLRLISAEFGLLSLRFFITLYQLRKLFNSELMDAEQLSLTEFIPL
jgi:hypothetical protein